MFWLCIAPCSVVLPTEYRCRQFENGDNLQYQKAKTPGWKWQPED